MAPKTCFIGNIPFDVGENSIRDIFAAAGPIQSLRMMKDAAGKPRGFAFCEYHDVNTAQSAIRNLNNTEIDGRFLRVSSAESDNGPSVATKEPVRQTVSGSLARWQRPASPASHDLSYPPATIRGAMGWRRRHQRTWRKRRKPSGRHYKKSRPSTSTQS